MDQSLSFELSEEETIQFALDLERYQVIEKKSGQAGFTKRELEIVLQRYIDGKSTLRYQRHLLSDAVQTKLWGKMEQTSPTAIRERLVQELRKKLELKKYWPERKNPGHRTPVSRPFADFLEEEAVPWIEEILEEYRCPKQLQESEEKEKSLHLTRILLEKAGCRQKYSKNQKKILGKDPERRAESIAKSALADRIKSEYRQLERETAELGKKPLPRLFKLKRTRGTFQFIGREIKSLLRERGLGVCCHNLYPSSIGYRGDLERDLVYTVESIADYLGSAHAKFHIGDLVRSKGKNGEVREGIVSKVYSSTDGFGWHLKSEYTIEYEVKRGKKHGPTHRSFSESGRNWELVRAGERTQLIQKYGGSMKAAKALLKELLPTAICKYLELELDQKKRWFREKYGFSKKEYSALESNLSLITERAQKSMARLKKESEVQYRTEIALEANSRKHQIREIKNLAGMNYSSSFEQTARALVKKATNGVLTDMANKQTRLLILRSICSNMQQYSQKEKNSLGGKAPEENVPAKAGLKEEGEEGKEKGEKEKKEECLLIFNCSLFGKCAKALVDKKTAREKQELEEVLSRLGVKSESLWEGTYIYAPDPARKVEGKRLDPYAIGERFLDDLIQAAEGRATNVRQKDVLVLGAKIIRNKQLPEEGDFRKVISKPNRAYFAALLEKAKATMPDKTAPTRAFNLFDRKDCRERVSSGTFSFNQKVLGAGIYGIYRDLIAAELLEILNAQGKDQKSHQVYQNFKIVWERYNPGEYDLGRLELKDNDDFRITPQEKYSLEIKRGEPELVQAGRKARSCLDKIDAWAHTKDFGTIYFLVSNPQQLMGYVRMFLMKTARDEPVLAVDTIEIGHKNFKSYVDYVRVMGLAAVQLGLDAGCKYVLGQESRIAYGPRQAFDSKEFIATLYKLGGKLNHGRSYGFNFDKSNGIWQGVSKMLMLNWRV